MGLNPPDPPTISPRAFTALARDKLTSLQPVEAKAQVAADKEAAIAAKAQAKADVIAAKEMARQQAMAAREAAKPSFADKMVQSAARSAATSVGRQVAGKIGGQLLRGLLGSLFK